MVETETLKVPAVSWRDTPRSTAASTLTLRSFEYAFMPAALHGFNAQATRCKALKAVGAAILGGLLSIFALPPRDADAARRRLLKTLWAVVNINADQNHTVTRSKGVTGSSKLGTGVYKIGFNQNVSGCACVATIDQSQVGFISAQLNSFVVTERDVVVSTYDTNGDAAEFPFSVVVHC